MIYVVLAAGSSRRMGFDKVFTPLRRGRTPLEYIARTLGVVMDRAFDPESGIVVVPPGHEADAQRMAPRLRVIVNAEPERGMTHSLRLALEATPPDEDFMVLLGDMPYVSEWEVTGAGRELLFSHADVAYPIRGDGTPGHPVAFAARTRTLAMQLPDGDTLRELRDHRTLKRATFDTGNEGAFLDLDVPEDWEKHADA